MPNGDIAIPLYYTELQIPNIKNGYYLHSHDTNSVYHPVLPNLLRPLATLRQHTSLQSWSKTPSSAFLLWGRAWRQRMLRSEERWKEGKMPLSLLNFNGTPPQEKTQKRQYQWWYHDHIQDVSF